MSDLDAAVQAAEHALDNANGDPAYDLPLHNAPGGYGSRFLAQIAVDAARPIIEQALRQRICAGFGHREIEITGRGDLDAYEKVTMCNVCGVTRKYARQVITEEPLQRPAAELTGCTCKILNDFVNAASINRPTKGFINPTCRIHALGSASD